MKNSNRKYIIRGAVVLVAVVFIIKLFSIQVLSTDYRDKAETNIIEREIRPPYRGLVYDRNGKLIVFNAPMYDLEVIPKEVALKDTLAFCNHFGITQEEFVEKMQKAKQYSYVKPSVFIKQISNKTFATVQDYLINYPGFRIQPRTNRAYTHRSLANALGYVGEISKYQLGQDSTSYYRQGDYIGISGIESNYEKQLRGKRGVKYKMVNVRGVEKGAFKGGTWDTLSVRGENLQSTIDIDLQEYAETLMMGKRGSVVAIEPKTGEVLTFVTAPSYDPNMLSGREYSKNFSTLLTDTAKPLFNRPLMGAFPPGSIFKTIQALIGLQEGVITPQTRFSCDRSIIACHGPHSHEDLKGAIEVSCNPYFWNTYKRILNQNVSDNTFKDTEIGLEKWRKHVMSFGLGQPLGIDLPNERGGYVPAPSLYDKIYGDDRWKFSTIYSNAIGQGELQIVPLQMANLSAVIANRGYYITPHLIKAIGEDGQPLEKYREKNYTTIDPQHFDVVVEAMADVVRVGTGSYRAKLKDIEVCGKTGTVQNSQGEDHSVFIAFAPKDDPQIAIAVYVENAGQGARAAAGISGLMIEKYIQGCTDRYQIEDYILKGKFIY
ncbi:penicillin-binding protein 2 [Catalinimonas niigatensis]|uniref:penicillin-binding protein 2 n=1 Tax=Catalinimonas niigatensis TaxID=1397264 RepID=UPI002666951F|nr:penicillin-binding protein 2 [Catalinimonas niigatensis]WPP53343.1 penicillin-binding protein 2 [Catalinimonas niigatensis]